MKKYVIIGNSTAAIGAVEGIRKLDREGSIVIISKEPHHTYSRPLISYLLMGKTDRERMKYRPDDFYEKNGCVIVFGKAVTKIAPDAKTVLLEDGQEFAYDKLLVATGSAPFVPPFEGLDKVKTKFSFMSLEDALKLEAALTPESRVLIVGAGLIGLKCAEAIAKRCAAITVADLSERVLSSVLEPESGELVKAHLENAGIAFRLGQSVKRFGANAAVMDAGEVIPFDILVLAVGVRPNTSLVKDAGGAVNRGILTDENMKTSLPDVYAAGDCTESIDISCGLSRILAVLPNAYSQGESAGIAMAGGSKPFTCAIPMNATGLLGLHLVTAGSYTGDCYVSKAEGVYKKLYYADGLLRGFILIGDVDKAGIYTALIREQIPLDSIDFGLLCEKPGLMAFSRAYRAEKLGGVQQ